MRRGGGVITSVASCLWCKQLELCTTTARVTPEVHPFPSDHPSRKPAGGLPVLPPPHPFLLPPQAPSGHTAETDRERLRETDREKAHSLTH